MKTFIELVDASETAAREPEGVIILEAEDKEEGNGAVFAQLMVIWIIQQCLMYSFQCEFAAAPGQEKFDITNDDKVKEKYDRLVTILNSVKEEDAAKLADVTSGKSSGSAEDNAKYAQQLIEACPKEFGDEIKEILKELKDYLGNQVAKFKLN